MASRLLWILLFFVEVLLFRTCRPLSSAKDVLSFIPEKLTFRGSPMCVTSYSEFEIVNNGALAVDVLWIESVNRQFHPAVVEPVSIAPFSAVSVQLIFLPQTEDDVEAKLLLTTSEGTFTYYVGAQQTLNPYRVRPHVVKKVVGSSSWSPQQIVLHNPHGDRLQVLEVHTADEFVHLQGVPLMGPNTSTMAMWSIEPRSDREIISFDLDAELPEGVHESFVYIETDHDKLVIPLKIEVAPVTIKLVRELFFGVLSHDNERKSIDIEFSNDGPDDLRVVDIDARLIAPTPNIQILHGPENIIRRSLSGEPVHSVIATLICISNEPMDFRGTIEVTTNSTLRQFAIIRANYSGSVTRGGVIYNEKETTFTLNWPKNGWPDKIVQFIRLQNGFHAYVTLNRVTLSSCSDVMKVGQGGKQNVVVSHGNSWPQIRLELFTENLRRHGALPKTCWLEVTTNITSQRVPIHIVHGRMEIKHFEAAQVELLTDEHMDDRYLIFLGLPSFPARDLRFIISNPNSISNTLNLEKANLRLRLCKLVSWPIGKNEDVIGLNMIHRNFQINMKICGNITVKPGYNALIAIVLDESAPPSVNLTMMTMSNRLHLTIRPTRETVAVALPLPTIGINYVNGSSLSFGTAKPIIVEIDRKVELTNCSVSTSKQSKVRINSAYLTNENYVVELLPHFKCFSHKRVGNFVPLVWKCVHEIANYSLLAVESEAIWNQLFQAANSVDFKMAMIQISTLLSNWNRIFPSGITFSPSNVNLRSAQLQTSLSLPNMLVPLPAMATSEVIYVDVPQSDIFIVQLELVNPTSNDIDILLHFEGDRQVVEVLDQTNYFLFHSSKPFNSSWSVIQSFALYLPTSAQISKSRNAEGNLASSYRIDADAKLTLCFSVDVHNLETFAVYLANSFNGVESMDINFNYKRSEIDVSIPDSISSTGKTELLLRNTGQFPVLLSDVFIGEQSCSGVDDYFLSSLFAHFPEHCGYLPKLLQPRSSFLITARQLPLCASKNPHLSVELVEIINSEYQSVFKKKIPFSTNSHCLTSSPVKVIFVAAAVCVVTLLLVLLVSNFALWGELLIILSQHRNSSIAFGLSSIEIEPIICLQKSVGKDTTDLADIPLPSTESLVLEPSQIVPIVSIFTNVEDSSGSNKVVDIIDNTVDVLYDNRGAHEPFNINGFGPSFPSPAIEVVEHLADATLNGATSPQTIDLIALQPTELEFEFPSSWPSVVSSNFLWGKDELENDPILNPSRGTLQSLFDQEVVGLGPRDTTDIDRLLSDDDNGSQFQRSSISFVSELPLRNDNESMQWLEMNNMQRTRWIEDDNNLFGPGSFFEKQAFSVADLVLESDDE